MDDRHARIPMRVSFYNNLLEINDSYFVYKLAAHGIFAQELLVCTSAKMLTISAHGFTY